MRQRLGRWRRWVTATRARRSALSLAVLVAMAAPFATGSYKYRRPYSTHQIPLTAEQREQIIARWGENTDNIVARCDEQAGPGRRLYCIDDLMELRSGMHWDLTNRSPQPLPSYLASYLALNGAVMLAVLTVTFFALTAAMAAVRKWWRWWW